MIHEKVSNRLGRVGNNVNGDRRIEYRIGATKKLISNLGPNFIRKLCKKEVNTTLNMKEDLFLKSRESYSVKIRSLHTMLNENFSNNKLGRAVITVKGVRRMKYRIRVASKEKD